MVGSVTRDWLYLRVRPGRPGDEVLRALAGRLRTADRGARWAFQRLVDRDGPHLGLWLHSRPEVLRELRAAARRTAPDDPITRQRHTPVGTRYLGDVAARTATDLSQLSSEFALDLLAAGGPDPAVLFAVTHLAQLAELLPARDRAAFLFQCWLHRAAELSAETRHELMGLARADAGAVLDAVAGQRWRPGQPAIWSDYLGRLPGVASAPGRLEPAPYVIFDHAHLTHNRLGIDAADEALAAQVVRTALLAGLEVPRMRRVALSPAA